MRFTKIKHKPKSGETFLEWTLDKDKATIRHELSSLDAPRPEFRAALQALKRPALIACELPLSWDDADTTVLGVSLTDNDTQGMGCVVTFARALPSTKAPLVINTPHLTEEEGSLSSSGLQALAVLEEEATRFMKGDRAQQDLFADTTVTLSAGGTSVTMTGTEFQRVTDHLTVVK